MEQLEEETIMDVKEPVNGGSGLPARLPERAKKIKDSGKLSFAIGALSTEQPEGRELARRVTATQDLTDVKRLIGTVQAQFDHIPQQNIEAVRATFPKTVSALRQLADRVLRGDYGEKFQQLARAPDDTLTSEALWLLLLYDTMRGFKDNKKEVPEFFQSLTETHTFQALRDIIKEKKGHDLSWILSGKRGNGVKGKLLELVAKNNVESTVARSLLRIFNDILVNLANPSQATVEQELQIFPGQEGVKRALKVAQLNPNTRGRSISFAKITENLFNTHRSSGEALTKALHVVRQNVPETQQGEVLMTVVDKFLKPHHFHKEGSVDADKVVEVVNAAEQIEDVAERDQVLRKIAIGLARNSLPKEATEVAAKIQDPNTKGLTQSSVVKILSETTQHLQQASDLAFSMTEQDYQDDAISYVVNGYFHNNQIDQAFNLVGKIRDKTLRNRAVKQLNATCVSSRNQDLINRVKREFTVLPHIRQE